MPWSRKVGQFRDIVDRAGLHGLVFQHLEICKRRAWFHLNRIDYAGLDDLMQMGVLRHSLHKSRDHSVIGLMGLAPDRVDWANRIVSEVKGTAGAQRAVASQTIFYALMLMAATGSWWRASNEIISTRRTRVVEIDEDEIDRMLNLAGEAERLASHTMPPDAAAIPMCKKCSYRFLCGRD